jgi:hypothetical protein
VDVVARGDDWLEPDGEEVEPAPESGYDDLDRGNLEQSADDDPAGSMDEPGTAADSALPPKVEAWRKRSATGAVLTGIALGLQQVFGKEREDPAIIMTTSGDPPRDLPVEAEVEHGRPRRSVVNIRPWLLETRGGPGSETGTGTNAPAAGPATSGADVGPDSRSATAGTAGAGGTGPAGDGADTGGDPDHGPDTASPASPPGDG